MTSPFSMRRAQYQRVINQRAMISYTERQAGANLELHDEYFFAPWNSQNFPAERLDAGYCIDAVNSMPNSRGYNEYFRELCCD